MTDLQRGRIRIGTLLTVCGLVASAVAYVIHANAATATRVSVLETKFDNLGEDLREIKTDLKALLNRQADRRQ